MSEQDHLQAADWRRQLRINQRRTIWVILIFFLIYLGIGFMLDLLLNDHAQELSLYSLSITAKQLLTLHIFPLFTIILAGAAAVSLLITLKLHDRLMLLGTDYVEVTSESTDINQKQLYNVVEEMKVAAGLRYMPRVY
ncbi:MAG: zinc metalloprotease HtpX, partial [Gammaproteobacteria bacterium]